MTPEDRLRDAMNAAIEALFEIQRANSAKNIADLDELRKQLEEWKRRLE